MKNFFYNKIIGVSILISLCFSLFLPYSISLNINDLKPQKNVAEAQWVTVGDLFTPAYNWVKKQLEDALDGLAKQAAIMLILELTQDIVAWIDSGFQGNPAFIQDPQNFLERVGDKAIGEFIFNEAGLKFLCDPFKIQVQLALGLQYQPFKNKVECTFTEILGNTENAYDDFIGGDFLNGGGWDSWFNITTNPSNNSQGAFLIAQSELDARIVTSQDNTDRETKWGNGAMSLQDCEETEVMVDKNGVKQPTGKEPRKFTGNPFYDEKDYNKKAATTSLQSMEEIEINGQTFTRDAGRVDDGSYLTTDTKCEVTTPGTIITNKLGFSDTSGGRMMEIHAATAKAFDAIITALANQVMTMALDSFKGGILGKGEGEQPDYRALYQQASEDLASGQATSRDDMNQRLNGGAGNTGGATGNNLTSLKNSAMQSLVDVNQREEAFISSRQDALSLLNRVRDAFVSTTPPSTLTCLVASNDPDRRIPMIQHIGEIIQGTSTTTPPGDLLVINDKIINILSLEADIALAQSNMASISARRDEVTSATTESAINSAVAELDSAPFHQEGDIQADAFANSTQNWMRQEIGNYASQSLPCSIDPAIVF